MLLAVDIGNTNIVIGLHEEDEWLHTWRVQTLTGRTSDEYSIILDSLFAQSNARPADVDKAIISSVVPQLTSTFRSILHRKTGFEPLVLDGTLDTGIAVPGRDPKSIGADLLADAVAAYQHFGTTCIVVDFGSATTVMAVDEPGVLLGGAIGSGLKITTDALVERTAQLTQIPLEPPQKAIGGNTVEAMKSGLVLGHLCMVEGLIDRMRNELGKPARVIATGGLSSTIAPYTEYFDALDPMLTLNGMRIVAERVKKQA
ncbi:type III pantothenate kinase [Halalkalibaculum sp. DA384]|uniref:type III pantothenate kinase n=1 Tax=Halalkalibaculum sp. DA384 TaxID=3373606 RepID=UPI003755079D